MKRLLALLSLALFFASCEEKKENKPAPVVKAETADDLKIEFLPVIQGTWIPSSYIKNLEENRSPNQSYDKLKGIAALAIPNTADGDKMEIGISLNNHEANVLNVLFKRGQSKHSLVTDHKDNNDSFEVKYIVTNKDTMLFVDRYSASGELLKSRQYSRVKTQSGTTAKAGIDYIVNKKLGIPGIYNMKKGYFDYTVTLGSDGSVEGLDSLKVYTIGTDYAVNNPAELPGEDYIYFKRNTNDSIVVPYSFKSKKDTLLLQRGKEKLRLIKQ